MPGTRPDRAASAVNGQTTNSRDPYALLGVKRSDSDAQVTAAFLRARALHDPANGGNEASQREVDDAYVRICTERGIAPEAPDTPVTVKAVAAEAPEPEQVADAEAVAEPTSVPPMDIVATSGRGTAARKFAAARRTGGMDRKGRDFGFSEKDRRALGRDLDIERMTLPQIAKRMRQIDEPLVKDRLEQLRAARLHGILWIAAQKAAARTRDNLPARDFARFKLGMPYERMRRSAIVATRWPEVVRAHRWITSPHARAQGWMAKAETGASYGLEILDLHRDFLDGFGPTDREDAAEARREEQAEAKRTAPVDAAAAETEARDDGRLHASEEAVAQAQADRDRIKEDFDTLWENSAREVQAVRRRAALWKGVAKRQRAAALAAGAPMAGRPRP